LSQDVIRSAQATPSNEVDALLDQWVARLEQPLDRAGPGGRGGTLPGPAARARARPGGGEVEGSRAGSVREALSRVTLVGSTARFADDEGGDLVLARVGQRTVHRGTVAVRGPLGLTLPMLVERGLTEPQARAVEFVAAWFGAPFDAVSATRTGDSASLQWGFWPLSRAEIARALGAWKARAPERFGAMIGVFGFDVVTRDDLRGPALMIVDPRGAILRGDKAIDAVASDPRRLAILARAGRDEHARIAQIEQVVAAVVVPILRTPVRRGESRTSVADVVATARGVAALLCAARALDVTAFDELVRVAIADAPADGGETAIVDSIARYLRVSGHRAAAHDVRRTLSSPELRS
jgi:hypothetical protein